MFAARFGDMTAHGGTITGPGCTTVLIGKMPAARMGDMHMCPMVTPGTPPVPHVGGPIVGGCPTVLIGKMPAARQTDMCICAGPPSSVMIGCPTVMIGSGGAGGGASGGGGGSTAQAKAAQSLQAGKISPVKGTESYPIDIQALALVMQKYCTPEGEEIDLEVIEAIANAGEAEGDREEEKSLTIKDVVEILENIELEDGYEAAKRFAENLDYSEINDLARGYINGEDTNEDNNPDLMPTRFMILFGADDNKLEQADDHPDRSDEEEHKNSVENMEKGLKNLDYDVKEMRAYKNDVEDSHVRYIRK